MPHRPPAPLPESIRWCSALQLVPENGAYHVRLMHAALDAINSPGPSSRQLSAASFRRWIELFQGPLLPLPGLMTYEVTTPAGGLRVFPGRFEDSYWVAERLLAAIAEGDGFPDDVRRKILRASLGTLRLSDAIAKKAGLERGAEMEPPGDSLAVPSGAKRRRLLDAVTFSQEDLRALDEPAALCHLITTADDLRDKPVEEIFRTPLLRADDKIVVLSPDLLPPAVTFHAVRTALEAGCQEAVAQAFENLVVHSTISSLEWMGVLLPIKPSDLGPPEFGCIEGFFQLDTDKALHLMALSDDLQDWNAPNRQWTTIPTGAEVERRLDEAAEAFGRDSQGREEVVHLVVVQGMDREYSLVLKPVENHRSGRVVFSASELEEFAADNAAEVLAVWRFAHAIAQVRSKVPIRPISQLEEYAFLSLNGWRFDDLLEDVGGQRQIAGFARLLRAKRVIADDPHAAPGPDKQGWITVVRRHPDQEHSAYVPAVPAIRRPPAVLLETPGFALWALPKDRQTPAERWVEIENWTNLIVFWLSRISTRAMALFDALAREVGVVYVTVDRRFSQSAERHPPRTPPWDIRVTDTDALMVTVDPEAETAFAGFSNTAERDFVVAVLRALATLVADPPGDAVLADHVTEEMEGRRNLRFVRHGDVSLVSSGAPFRVADDWSETRARRFLGEGLVSDGLKPDPRSPATNEYLNEIVRRAFAHLERLMKSLRPDGTVKWLIGLNEELVHRGSSATLEGYMELAVAHTSERLVRRRVEEMSDITRASVASRFLIEVAASTTFGGSRTISFALYDEMLAFAALIIQLGALSDLVREGLDEARIAILDDGTLVDVAFDYYRGMETFGRAAWADEVSEEPLLFSDTETRRDDERDNAGDPAIDRLESAYRQETGFSLTEQSEFVRALGDIAPSDAVGPVILPLDDAIDMISRVVEWDRSRVATLVQNQTLWERGNYLTPPPGHLVRDLYPWRFNRSLSYLRRPLLIRNTGEGVALVYGPRHIIVAWDYLVASLFSGRYPATTAPLKRLMSIVQRGASDEFNREVAEVCSQIPQSLVRLRFSKIGGRRLADESGTIGDIDVLVADRRKALIRCIEVKRLARGGVPHQVANELRETFGMNHPKPSAVERHLRRTRFVEANIDSVLSELGIQDSRRWRVWSAIVTNVETISPYVVECPLPVFSLSALRRHLGI